MPGAEAKSQVPSAKYGPFGPRNTLQSAALDSADVSMLLFEFQQTPVKALLSWTFAAPSPMHTAQPNHNVHITEKGRKRERDAW